MRTVLIIIHQYPSLHTTAETEGKELSLQLTRGWEGAVSTAYKGVGGGCVYSLQGGGRGLCLQLTRGWEGAVSTAYKGVGGGCVYSLQGGGRGLCLQLTRGWRLELDLQLISAFTVKFKVQTVI